MRAASRAPGTVRAPAAGLWRVGRKDFPLAPRRPADAAELEDPRLAGRFDDPAGTYGVIYLAKAAAGCFGEVLAPLRADPALAAKLAGEGEPIGVITPQWRASRALVRAAVPGSARFLDLEDPRTVQALRRELGWALPSLGLPDIDIGVLRGPDRRITRLVSAWAHARTVETDGPRYGGVRYLSRLNGAWECFCVFEEMPLRELERREILRDDAALVEVADLYGLRIL